MAVPKKSSSVSRKGLRRAGQHHKLYRKHPNSCPNCGDLVLNHRACSSCGHYRGRQAFEIKVKEVEEEEQTQE